MGQQSCQCHFPYQVFSGSPLREIVSQLLALKTMIFFEQLSNLPCILPDRFLACTYFGNSATESMYVLGHLAALTHKQDAYCSYDEKNRCAGKDQAITKFYMSVSASNADDGAAK